MAKYRYRSIANNGTIIRGILVASSETAAIQELRSKGQYPISAKAMDGTALSLLLSKLKQVNVKHSLRSLALATQELSSLLLAGVELDRALGILSQLQDAGEFSDTFRNIRAQIRDGATLADALAKSGSFPSFYVSMVRTGEFGGNLPETLRRVADYLSRSLAIRETISSAFVYPAILIVTAGMSIVIILTLVLPQFKPLFEEAGQELPLPTRIVMSIGELTASYWWLVLLVTLGLWLWFNRSMRNEAFQLRVHNGILKLPILGPLLRDMEVERFVRSTGTMLTNGVALPTALSLSEDILWNRQIALVVRRSAKRLREGENLADHLAQSDIFPAAMLDLIQIGQETGKLDEMLLRQADLDEKRIQRKLERLMALLVPVITILLGIIVAALIASMLVAILSVNDLALS